MEAQAKDLRYYRSLPYTRKVRVEQDEGGEYFVAFVEELAGLESDGLTDTEARFNLQEAFDDFISALLEQEVPIAEPEFSLSREGTVRRSGLRALKDLVFRRRSAPCSSTTLGAKIIEPEGTWVNGSERSTAETQMVSA